MGRVLAYVKRGRVPVRIMNLSTRPVLIKPHAHLADAFLCWDVLQGNNEKQHSQGSEQSDEERQVHRTETEVCQSQGQVVHPNPEGHTIPWRVDLSEAAVEGEEQRVRLRQLVEKNDNIFSQHSTDFGHTKTVQHEIPLIDARPFRLPYRKLPPAQWQEVRSLLKDMEESGVIRPSKRLMPCPLWL